MSCPQDTLKGCGTCATNTAKEAAAAIGAPSATGGGTTALTLQSNEEKQRRIKTAKRQIENHELITDPEILRLADNRGWTVAHYAAASQGQQFTDPEILNLANDRGLTVADVARRKKTPGPSA